jgi:uncharacterized protein YggT (Ycf19 family)
MFDAIDFILNVAGLLLWLNWRSVRLDPFTRGVPATLAGTVRRAEPMRLKRWHFLAALAGLLVIRAFFYVHIGGAANWTPKLKFILVTPAFPLVTRGHAFFLSTLFFSVASFLELLVIFYLWLLAIAILNRRETSPDPLQKLLLLQLGRIGRWPVFVQLISSVLLVAVLWMLFHPLLLHVGVTAPVRSNAVLFAQGAVLSVFAWLTLKFLLLALLLVHLIVTYVYFGANPLWDFINTTAKNLLAPFKFLPLRFGRVDLSPIVGIILIVLLLYVLPDYLLHALDRHGRTIWPQ